MKVLSILAGAFLFLSPVLLGTGFGQEQQQGQPSQPNVLRGGPGNDMIIGTDQRDVIIGGTGNDVLRGEGGADVIEGGPGDDLIEGETFEERYLESDTDD